MVINNEITLDISKQTQFVKISLPQGDNVDRVFKINLVNGVDTYIIPTTATVRFEMARPDGSIIYNNCPVENNQAVLEITPPISAIDGRFPAQFRITDSSTGGLIKSFRFHILIHESVDIENAVVNTSEFTALQDMELRVGDITPAIQAAETATDNANNAADSANDIADQLEVETLIIWKPYVSTYVNIATTYPIPELGWTTQAQDTGIRWRYNGTEWINIGVVSDDKVGDLSTVTTTNKINVVGAINELDSQLADNTNHLKDIATNIKTFGAKCDYINNDAPAIQLAIASGATTIILPKGTRIDTTIDCTNRADSPLLFKGEGWSEYDTLGTKIYCNTGGIAFDFTGSQYISMEDILLYSDNNMTNPSTIGILIARSSTSLYAQFHSYRRLYIFLCSKSTVIADCSIGILNISGEHFNFEHGLIIADLPLALMATNILGKASPYVTFGGAASCSLISFKQVGFLAYTQSSMQLWNCYNVKFDMCIWFRTPSNTAIQAIVLNNGCNNITINGQIEQYSRAIQFNGDATNTKLELYIDSNATAPLIYLYGAIKLYNPKVSINQRSGIIQQIFATNNSPIIYGGEIVIQPGQGLNLPALKLMGTNVVLCGISAVNVNVLSTSNYTINSSKILSISDGVGGFMTYVNGHVEQWLNVVYDVAVNTDQTFDLPMEFPTSCDNVQLTPIGSSNVIATENGRSKTSVTIRCSVTPANIYVKVIGH